MSSSLRVYTPVPPWVGHCHVYRAPTAGAYAGGGEPGGGQDWVALKVNVAVVVAP